MTRMRWELLAGGLLLIALTVRLELLLGPRGLRKDGVVVRTYPPALVVFNDGEKIVDGPWLDTPAGKFQVIAHFPDGRDREVTVVGAEPGRLTVVDLFRWPILDVVHRRGLALGMLLCAAGWLVGRRRRI